MHFKDYYAEQSEITRPGQYSNYLYELPNDVALLAEIVRGLILHHSDSDLFNYSIPKNRLNELELRYVIAMLHKIFSLNNKSLIYKREPKSRVIGCCRDFALLLCSFLRYKKIPARLRFGFTTFQLPNFHHDQVLLEYWHAGLQKWCLVDARVNAAHLIKHKLNTNYDWCDVPRDQFYTAAEAWILCRNGYKNPEQFGTGFIPRLSGWWYIRNKLIQDLAALNKKELLLWDCWGMMLQNKTNDFMQNKALVERLDYFAELLYEPDNNFEELRLIYHLDSDVTVPQKIYSAGLMNSAGWVNLAAA